MKPTPELINDWHEKARQMAIQADGYFDDVEHWRHFAELAAAWGAEQARDEANNTPSTEHCLWARNGHTPCQHTQQVQALQTTEEPELPEPFGYLSVHKVEGPFKYQFNKERAAVYPDNAISIDAVFTAAQMHDYFAAGVRSGMGQSQALQALQRGVDKILADPEKHGLDLG